MYNETGRKEEKKKPAKEAKRKKSGSPMG